MKTAIIAAVLLATLVILPSHPWVGLAMTLGAGFLMAFTNRGNLPD